MSTAGLDLAASRDMLALMLALETGDDATAQLIRERADPWPMLRWAIRALSAEVARQGKDPAQYARDMIARTVRDGAVRDREAGQ